MSTEFLLERSVAVRSVTRVQPMDPRSAPGAPASHPQFRPNTPLVVALAWLGGTYVAFLLLGQASRAPDLWTLSVFVGATLLALMIGYRLESGRPRQIVIQDLNPRQVRRVTLWSGVYLSTYGLALLSTFGVTGPGGFVNAVVNPGQAYESKFDTYAAQLTQGSNVVIQVLTLLAALYVPLVPFTILFWSRLTPAIRIVAILGMGLYASFYLYIGTLKGLGDLLVFGAVGAMVRQAQTPGKGARTTSRKRLVAVGTVTMVLFGGYMAYNQSQRLAVFNNQGSFEPNPVVGAVMGDAFARGVSVVAFYPTHGYLGLAYNLGTPFAWTHGQGSSIALDSYLAQYGLADSVADATYPARTEQLTGWPQDTFWATAYPWLASDLTFPGVVLLMGVLGWWLSRLWREAVIGRSQLALLLLADLFLFVIFIPANNQIGLSRPATIGFLTLVILYVLSPPLSGTRAVSRARAKGGEYQNQRRDAGRAPESR